MLTADLNPRPQIPMSIMQNQSQSTRTLSFESQSRRLKAYFKDRPQELLGCHVMFAGSQAIVRYFGKLAVGSQHTDPDQLWVGVQWDDPSRGKHNGTVQGHKYFQCEQNSGSMVKYDKIEFGYKVQTGFFKRYFRDEEIFTAKSLYKQLQEIKKAAKDDVQKKQLRDQLGKRKVNIEVDSEAYVETFKKNKVMVEFVGFDEIWSKIHNLEEVTNINLPDVQICDVDGKGSLRNMFPNLEIFSLEKNLLHDWNQAYLCGYQLERLKEFTLTKNKFKQPEDVLTLNSIKVMYSQQVIQVSPVNIFKNLKSMILIDTQFNWKILFKVCPSFPGIQELVLCRNKMHDVENIAIDSQHAFSQLKFINLEETEMKDQHFEGIKKLKDLPKLERLIMNRNLLKRFGDIEGFKALKCLSLEYNLIDDPFAISELSKLSTLEYFNIKHNPVASKLGIAYVRQRSVSEFPVLKWINNSDLKKYERKDNQIYYMREVFHQYFNIRKVPDFDYDYEDFLKWTVGLHPNIGRLIKIYGIPYQPQVKEIVKLINEDMPNVAKKSGGSIELTLEIRSGPTKGSISQKKVATSWTVANLKILFSKTMKIPVKNQRLTVKTRENADQENMDQDHKPLASFNLGTNSIIYMQYEA